MALLPRYNTIKSLPMVKRTAVTNAPVHTSDQATLALGKSLKIMAKSSVITAKDISELTALPTGSGHGTFAENVCPNALNPALRDNETRSKKAVPKSPKIDKNRRRSRISMPSWDLGSTPQ